MNSYYTLLSLILLIFLFLWKIPCGFKSTLDVMEEHGIVGEAHNVTTEDGYILTLHRINGGVNATPVLFVGGLTTNSEIWLLLGRNKSLPYLLADQGYDVWLSNNRGNIYADSHANLSTNDQEFWNFSYHEMGYYDAPAMIKYISSLSNKKVIYIGHSQGTKVGFVMASTRPDAAQNVSVMVQLAPVAFLDGIKGLMRYIHQPLYLAYMIARNFITVDIISKQTVFSIMTKQMFSMLCHLGSYICEVLGSTILGFDHDQFSPGVWDGLFRGFSSGTSIKNLVHYYQSITNGTFAQYDYGNDKNIQIYNQSSPPEYNLSQISVPTYFYCSKDDWLAPLSNAEKIWKLLPNQGEFHLLEYEKFTHGDYIYAKDVKEILYDHVIDLLRSYKNI